MRRRCGPRERASFLLGLGLFALSAIVLIGYSARTGPAFDELSRVEAVEHACDVVRAVAQHGFGELGRSGAFAPRSSTEARSSIAVLLGAWSELSAGRVGLLDPLTSARLPWLLFAALGPALLYALVSPSRGPLAGAVAGLLLLSMPGFGHAAAVTSEAVTRSTAWVLVLALSQRAMLSRGRAVLAWSAAAAVALGAGSALTFGALWALPLAVLHFWLCRRHQFFRLLRCGRVALPAFVPLALVVVPAVVFALTPALWTMNVVSLVRWALAPLAPSVEPALFAGRLVTELPVPLGFASTWLVFTLPAATLACVLVGLGVLGHRALARRFARGRLRPRRDRTALGGLVALGLAMTLIGPACVPAPLAVFPPDAAAALPFAAIAAALGVDRVARVAYERRPLLPLALTLGTLTWMSVARPETASASFDHALGGPRTVAQTRLLPLGDGSGSSLPFCPRLNRSLVTSSA